MRTLLPIALTFASLTVFGQKLTFETPQKKQSYSLNELLKKVSPITAKVQDPVREEQMAYKCLPLKKLFQALNIDVKAEEHLIFEALDGYKVTKTTSVIDNGKPCLAYQESKNDNLWTPYQQGKENIRFAPFYLIWQSDNGHHQKPWAYKLTKISSKTLTKKRHVPPKSKSKVYAGYEIFKEQCQKCHSLNLRGGSLGPELNVPKNITEYWKKKDILMFIQNPESYRKNSKMPAFKNVLSEKEVRSVYEYLVYMKDHKEMPKDSLSSK